MIGEASKATLTLVAEGAVLGIAGYFAATTVAALVKGRQGSVGLKPNEQRHTTGLEQDPSGYDLATVEFDDQGRQFSPGATSSQMQAVTKWLADHAEQDAIIAVFVHGWRHNAEPDDCNFTKFRDVLAQMAEREGSQRPRGSARPVLGIYVGWRGLSMFDSGFGLLEYLTFWDRQQTGRRVSTGSVRELFGRLRLYRRRRAASSTDAAPLLIIVGHSFGGMIAYSALAQSLVEKAVEPVAAEKTRSIDLLVLVNPAVEATRYLPVHDAVQASAARPDAAEPPAFICVTADNDWATKYAFPVGNGFSYFDESWRDREERQAMINTLGHVAWMRTHRLSTATRDRPYDLVPERTSPFMVVGADKSVVNGHNGIWQPPFMRFLADQIFEHVDKQARSRQLASASPARTSPPAPPGTEPPGRA